jgi:hypothetical protein
MKIKAHELDRAAPALDELLKMELPATLHVRVLRLRRMAQETLSPIWEAHNALVERHGAPHPDAGGRKHLAPGMPGYAESMAELMEIYNSLVEVRDEDVIVPSDLQRNVMDADGQLRRVDIELRGVVLAGLGPLFDPMR